MPRYRKSIQESRDIIDQDAPRTNTRYGILSEAQLQITSEYLGEAIRSGVGGKNELMGLQFLFNLLTPTANPGVIDLVSYNPITKQNNLIPHFNKNINNERLVFTLLDKLRLGKMTSDVIGQEMAQSFYNKILEQHNAAFLKEWDPTLEGKVFNFKSYARQSNDFNIMSLPDVLPKFATQHKIDGTTLNQPAKQILMSYLNGTYFMSPIELYRMTLNLRKGSLGADPAPDYASQFIRKAWEGSEGYMIDPSGNWQIAKKTFRNESYEHMEYNRGKNMYQDALDKWNTLCK